jgi:hypothetical protein
MCGLDPRRVTLRGNEVRACWVGAPNSRYPDPPPGAPGRGALGPTVADGTTRVARTFVPVEDVGGLGEAAPLVKPPGTPEPAPDPGIWSLWGDAET